MRRSGNFKLLASRTLLGKITGGVAGIAVALWGFGPWAVIAQALVMEWVSIVVLMLGDRRRIAFRIDPAFLRELIATGAPIAVNILSFHALQRGTSVLLGMTAGASAVGIFNLALRIIDLPRAAIYAGLTGYALPVFARRINEPARLVAFIRACTQVTGFVLTPLFVGIAVCADDIILLIFGSKWVEAIPLLQVLAVATAIGNVAMYASTALVALNRTRLTLKAEVGTTLLALGLVYGLSGTYGAMAAALAMLVRMLLVSPLQINGLRTAIGLGWSEFLAPSYRSILASVVMAGALSWLSPRLQLPGFLHLSATIGLGALIYIAAYSLLHPRWLPEFKAVFSTR
jgi:O-antigen/teichoic acid export membrane protein